MENQILDPLLTKKIKKTICKTLGCIDPIYKGLYCRTCCKVNTARYYINSKAKRDSDKILSQSREENPTTI